MCIIAIYTAGKRPTAESIKTMMTRNADGAGVAWNDGKAVHFKKGFTTPAEVMEYIRLADERGARDIVFHSRIATSGGVSPAKCHPFPVSTKNDVLNATEGEGKTPLFFHNGVFAVQLEKGLSDTQTFVKYSLAPLFRADARGVFRGVYDELIDMATAGSRVAIIYPNRVVNFGTWTRDEGILYSNYTFRKWNYATSYSYGGEWEYNEDGRMVWKAYDGKGGATYEK